MALGLLALAAPGRASAEEKGYYDDPYLWGSFDATPNQDDWFYDSYSYDRYSRDWFTSPWYDQQEAFSGLFDPEAGASQSWFFDSYGQARNEPLFDKSGGQQGTEQGLTPQQQQQKQQKQQQQQLKRQESQGLPESDQGGEQGEDNQGQANPQGTLPKPEE